jgi:hypothetical protein
VAGAEPLAAPKLNQAAVLFAVQESDPPPLFEIATVLAAGLEPPAVAVKLRLSGVALNVGALPTLRETATVLGEPVAPADETVMVSE